MTYKTHLLGGISGSILLMKYTEIIDSPDLKSASLVLAGSIIGCLLPDIDHHKSFIGKKTFGVFSFLKHRGITHSILFAILLFCALDFFSLNKLFNIGLLFGVMSHIMLDLMTKSGLDYVFYPLKFKISLLPIKTDGISERLLFFVIFVSSFFLIIS